MVPTAGSAPAAADDDRRSVGSAVLLVGNHLPSLSVARVLGRAGYRVVAGDGGEYSEVRRSRYCGEVWRHPPIGDRDGFLAALLAFLGARADVSLVLPLQDAYVTTLASVRERLPRGVTLVAPEAAVVATCADKHRMHELALECGVPSRSLEMAPGYEAVALAAATVGYPCIVRPRHASAGLGVDRKALICPDRTALQALLRERPWADGELLVQRYVPGPRHNVVFIARGGRMLASIETKVVRTDRADGTGVAVEEAVCSPHPGLAAFCDALLARLGYDGVGSAQFIVPADGEPCFLEVNARHDAAVAGVEACGLPLTLAAVAIATHVEWQPGSFALAADGYRYAWTSRDLYGLGMALSRREIGYRSALRWLAGALRAAIRADVHLTWSRDDPLPTLALYAHLATLGPWRRRATRDRAGRRGPHDGSATHGRKTARHRTRGQEAGGGDA